MENLPDNENINVTPAPAEPVENTPEATPSATASQPQAEACIPPQPPQYTPAYVPPVYTGYGVPYGTNNYNVPSYTVPPVAPPYYGGAPAGQPAQAYNQSPANVYNSAQSGSIPQYHYGNPAPPIFDNKYYLEQQEKLAKRREAEKKIRHVGNISGAALLGCFIVALLYSVLLAIPPVAKLYTESLTGSSFINMFYTLIVVGITFVLFSKCYKDKKCLTPLSDAKPVPQFTTSFNFPKNPLKMLLLVVIGFGGCMIANWISSILLTLLETTGIHSTYSAVEDPLNLSDTILMVISVAIIPPLVEEYALRGSVMTNLRRYGNVFAIVASAFMFGIFHGNAAQILFAFLCGIIFGYATIATESLWTAIIIHALNNSLSCITSLLIKLTDEEIANGFYYATTLSGIALAGVALILYMRLFKEDSKILKFKGEADVLTDGQKIGKFITSPVMIVAIIIYGIQALLTLTTKNLS